MKRFLLAPVSACFVLAVLSACSVQEPEILTEDSPAVQTQEVTPAYIPGVVTVQFSEDLTRQIEEALADGIPVATKAPQLGGIMQDLGIQELRRVFPYAGEFEERTRREGLHRFYYVKFQEETPVTKAAGDISRVPGVERVTPQLPVKLRGFNDPRLGDARLCGTTASLCGLEAARAKKDAGAIEWALRMDLMLHAFMFTLSGVPVLYSGDEIGRPNDYSYHGDPHKREDSRWIHRGDMDWAAARRRDDPESVEGRLYAGLRQLETLRTDHRAFDGSADTWIVTTGDDSVLGIGRYHRGEKLVGLFNFAETQRQVSINELGDYIDICTGEAVDKRAVLLPSGGFRWLLCDFEKGEALP